jgi:hypothetical protein
MEEIVIAFFVRLIITCFFIGMLLGIVILIKLSRFHKFLISISLALSIFYFVTDCMLLFN